MDVLTPSFKLSRREYVRLAENNTVELAMDFVAPMPPTTYARVSSKETGEVTGWLWWSPGVERWIAFGPENVTPEVEELFDG